MAILQEILKLALKLGTIGGKIYSITQTPTELQKQEKKDIKSMTLYQRFMDFVQSSSVSRIITIACAPMLFLFPVSPIIAGIGMAAVILSVGVGVVREAIKRNYISRLRKEDRLLNKISSLTETKLEKFRELQDKLKDNPDPKIQELLATIKQDIEATLSNGKSLDQKSSIPIVRSFFGTAFESFVTAVAGLCTLNPVVFGLSAVTAWLTYKQEYDKTKRYDEARYTLLNNMEKAKSLLGMQYNSGKGFNTLVVRKNAESGQIKGLDTLLNNVDEIINDPKKAMMLYKQDKDFYKDDNNKPKETKLLINHIKSVVFNGFSVEKTERKLNPLCKHEKEYANKLADSINAFKADASMITLGKQENKQIEGIVEQKVIKQEKIGIYSAKIGSRKDIVPKAVNKEKGGVIEEPKGRSK